VNFATFRLSHFTSALSLKVQCPYHKLLIKLIARHRLQQLHVTVAERVSKIIQYNNGLLGIAAQCWIVHETLKH